MVSINSKIKEAKKQFKNEYVEIISSAHQMGLVDILMGFPQNALTRFAVDSLLDEIKEEKETRLSLLQTAIEKGFNAEDIAKLHSVLRVF